MDAPGNGWFPKHRFQNTPNRRRRGDGVAETLRLEFRSGEDRQRAGAAQAQYGTGNLHGENGFAVRANEAKLAALARESIFLFN